MAKADGEDAGKSELAGTMKEINKRYGSGSMSIARGIPQPGRISTGSFMLDFSLLGGIPQSRVSMIIGERHAGKTLLSDKITASAQRMFPDQQVVVIDVEGTKDMVWAEKLGVDLDRLLLFQPETGEAAVDVADAVTRSKEVSLVIVDSLAAMSPMKELENSAEDAHVGLQARLIGGMIRKLTAGVIAERRRGHNVAILFINQFRAKIGGYGDPRCVHADTLVCFVDGRSIPIRKVVDERITGEVWSLNERTRVFEARQIIDWHYNGQVEDGEYLSIKAQGVESRNGVFGLTVTTDHQVLTDMGWVRADALRIGSLLVSKYTTQHTYLSRVIDVAPASKRKMRQRGKYDISVEGNHNYLVGGSTNGVVIHNSIPGGKAVEFCASVQLIIKNKEKMGKDDSGIESPEENEHSYTIQKNKLNSGPRTGEFRLRRTADSSLGLVEGDIDDVSTMLAFAKKFGVYTGGGSSWELAFWDFERKFRGLADAEKYFYENRDQYAAFRNFLLYTQAKSLGMPDAFLDTFL